MEDFDPATAERVRFERRSNSCVGTSRLDDIEPCSRLRFVKRVAGVGPTAVASRPSQHRGAARNSRPMTFTQEGLLNGYLAHANAVTGRHRDDSSEWAEDEMRDVIHADPEIAWEVVKELVARAPDDSILAFVAAGPLENLICAHPDTVIDRVERRAAENARFRKALRAVWGWNRMPGAIRDRLDAAVASEPAW